MLPRLCLFPLPGPQIAQLLSFLLFWFGFKLEFLFIALAVLELVL